MRWTNPGRQSRGKRGVIERDVEIGQDRLRHADPFDRGKRIIDVEMCRVRFIAQGIDDPALDTIEHRSTVIGQSVDVGRVSQFANPEAQ